MQHQRFSRLFDGFLAQLDGLSGLSPTDYDTLFTACQGKLDDVMATAQTLSKGDSKLALHHSKSSTALPVVSDATASTKLRGALDTTATSRPASADHLSLDTVRKLENLIAVKLRQHSGGPTALFLRYDVDGKGVITFDQFKLAVNAVGIRLTDAEAHAILDRYDPFGDGSISYTDFVDLVEGVDVWSTETLSEYTGLSLEHAGGLPVSMTPRRTAEKRLAQLRGLVRSKINAHTGSAAKLYLTFKYHNKSGPLGLSPLRHGLKTYGLDISYTDLQRVLGPYMKADPGRSIQLGELQDFLDNAYVPGMESFDASSVSAKFLGTPSQPGHPTALQRIKDAFSANPDALLASFRRFDGRHTGFVSVDVFRSLMDLKGLRFTLQECREIAKYLDKDAKEFVQYGKLIELIERPLDVAAEEKEMPPKAPENEGIRRTHSDTTSLGKNILTDLYRTEAVQVPDVPHYETIDARDSHSPVAVKPNEGKRDVSVAAPGGLKASKATLDRISDAFTGHTTTALFKRLASTHSGITVDDLVHGLKLMGVTMSRLNAKAVISQFDTDGDGKLNLREFQRLHAEL